VGVFASIDGVVVPASEARVSVLDNGFVYGDSVYETLRTYGGRPFQLDRHLRRLRRSAERLAIGLPLADAALSGRLDETLRRAANPESAIRAGTLGLPMALAIIGGEPARFAPFAKLHRQAAARSGHDVPPMSINSHGYIAPTSQEALDESFPSVAAAMNRIGRERNWAPMTRSDYDNAATLHGANFVGSPQQVVEKILFQHEIFGHDRFLIQFGVGAMPHAKILRSIELLGTEVAPAVRAEVARRTATSEAG